MVPVKVIALVMLLHSSAHASIKGGPLHRAVGRQDVEKVRKLVDRGANVNKRNKYGKTPIMYAVSPYSNLEIAKILVEGGADLSIIKGGRTAVAMVWDTQILRFLLENGANVNYVNGEGNSPLIRWTLVPHIENVKVVLEFGPNLKIKNRNGQTALDIAKGLQAPNPALVKLLEEASVQAAERKRRKTREAAEAEIKSKLPDILAAESAGDQARDAGKKRAALARYIEALKLTPKYTEKRRQLTDKTIQLARSMRPRPVVPEDAKHHALRAKAFVEKAKDQAGFAKAAAEFAAALEIAPWWANAHFNMGLVKEKAGDYHDAISHLKLYLAANPSAKDAGAVKAKLAQLEVALELGE